MPSVAASFGAAPVCASCCATAGPKIAEMKALFNMDSWLRLKVDAGVCWGLVLASHGCGIRGLTRQYCGSLTAAIGET